MTVSLTTASASYPIGSRRSSPLIHSDSSEAKISIAAKAMLVGVVSGAITLGITYAIIGLTLTGAGIAIAAALIATIAVVALLHKKSVGEKYAHALKEYKKELSRKKPDKENINQKKALFISAHTLYLESLEARRDAILKDPKNWKNEELGEDYEEMHKDYEAILVEIEDTELNVETEEKRRTELLVGDYYISPITEDLETTADNAEKALKTYEAAAKASYDAGDVKKVAELKSTSDREIRNLFQMITDRRIGLNKALECNKKSLKKAPSASIEASRKLLEEALISLERLDKMYSGLYEK